jgi:prepilin-type N-terminal cleavage/methylation domain-containing protein
MSRAARHEGFTLPELLIGISMAVIVALAAFSILDVVMKDSGHIAQRVDSTQRGRMALDVLTSDLRSQVCLTPTDPTVQPPVQQPIKSTALTATPYSESLSFYADSSDGRQKESDGVTPQPPDLRTITYDGMKHTIVEQVRRASSGSGVTTVYPSTPTNTRTILSNVYQDGSNPIFTYYSFGTVAPLTPNVKVNPGTDTTVISRIAVDFRVLATGLSTPDNTATTLSDDIYVRLADPNDPAPIPTCA